MWVGFLFTVKGFIEGTKVVFVFKAIVPTKSFAKGLKYFYINCIIVRTNNLRGRFFWNIKRRLT